eukprot:CCRYP_005465-RA/>CCRYP_005465-RA protein AED:0.33 eAED:-0.26 QI:227/0.33/0.28/0.57/1/1/7/0/2002
MQRKPRISETIKVFFRVRPLNAKEKQDGRNIATIAHEDHGTIEIRNRSPSSEGGVESSSKTFSFDAVFSDKASQRHIYDVCAAPVVQSVLEGYNGTVFAYGQTGAGKTHTMEGVNDTPELRGIIPNSFQHIFDFITLDGSNDKYLVRASYFEIYNEEIRDLLSKSQISLELKESADSGVYVKDLTSLVVKSVEEIDHVLQRGKKNRSVGATLMNTGSSRSHSVFSIVVECCSNDGQREHIRVGKLNLVDLAGSERQSKTGATGDRLQEATKINLSLSALGNVISALVDGKAQHIPYRDSKLTRILQDSLGGNTKTVMVANAGPADYNYEESLSTLRYANRTKKIENKPVINEDPKDAMLREYQEEILRLKERLSQMPPFSNDTSKSGDFDEQRKEFIIEEFRSKSNKENEEMRAKAEAEMAKLRSDNNQTTEERRLLAEKLAEEKRARLETENERLELRKQLDEMEAKLVMGGEVANNARKQDAKLRRANQELTARKEQELALTRKMNEQEEEKLYLEEKYSSLAEEVVFKTKKLKKIWTKYQQAKTEIKDLETEFLEEKNAMVNTIRDLTKQLKLKEFIISSFIPPKYALLYDAVENGGRAVFDEARETWTIPSIKTQVINTRTQRRHGLKGFGRPETEYAQGRKMADRNVRWHAEDIVDLDIEMPTQSSLSLDHPNTAEKIAFILSMDLNDYTEELPQKDNRREKLLRLNNHKYSNEMESFCFSHIEDELHFNFAKSRCDGDNSVYVERDFVNLRLDAYCDGATSQEHSYPFVVTGHSGGGKSAALANWTTRRKAHRHPTRDLGCYGEFIFWHAVGCSRLSTTISCLLRRLVTSLTNHFELKEVIDIAEEKLPWIFPRLLERASKKGKVIIVIDGGLQHCNRNDEGHGLKWLPLRLPPNVRMILSVTIPCSNPPLISGHATNLQNKTRLVWNEIQRRQYSTIEMEKFDNNFMRAVIDKFLLLTASSDPSISRSQLCDQILSVDSANNAFFLTTILRGLLHVHSCLGLDHDSATACLAMWTSSEVRSSMDLLDRMLTVFESDPRTMGAGMEVPAVRPEDGPSLTLDTNTTTTFGSLIGHALSLLFVARHGLHENELLDLLARARDHFRWMNQTKGTIIPVKLKLLKSILHEKRRLIDIFCAFDTDGNGTVSHEEFFKGMQRLDLKGVTHDEVTLLINEVDTNCDGEIDFVETLDYFEDIWRRYMHGARRGSVFGNQSSCEMISKDRLSLGVDCIQSLTSTLQTVGVVCMDIKEQGRILVLPFENSVLRDVVWKKYIRTRKGEAQSRALLTEYFLAKEPSLRICEELPWHLKKSNDMITLKKVLGDLRILDDMYNTKELKAELFIYLRRLSQASKFDMVIEYNRAIEHWYQNDNPSSSRVSSMAAFLADVMLWYSKNISTLIEMPPFMRTKLDDAQLHKLGIEWETERSNINTKKVEKIRPDTDYFFNRWTWIQFPWLALRNTSKAVVKEITSDGLLSYKNGTMPSRQRAMVRSGVVIQRHTTAIKATTRGGSNCHFDKQGSRGEKDDLRNLYIQLSRLKKYYDSDVVEASEREKYLNELERTLSEKNLADDQNQHKLAAGEAAIEKLRLRLDQIKHMIAQATHIESFHEQILVVLQSCQPRFQPKHLELEQQIALCKQQISDIRERQDKIDGEIGKIKTCSKKVSTEIQVALREKQNLQPRLEALHCKAREGLERKKSERLVSFDPELFSRRMKREGIVAKRRLIRNHGNESNHVVDSENLSLIHPMQIIAYAAGSFDPLHVAKMMQSSESLAKDLYLSQEKSELHTQKQHDTLNDLQQKITEHHLSHRIAPKVARDVDDQDVKDLELLVQTHQSNLQQLSVLVKHVSLALRHLVDMTESIHCGDSEKNQLNSFIFAMDASKLCLGENLKKMVRVIKMICNATLERGELQDIKVKAGSAILEAGSNEEKICGDNDNLRVLNKLERESLYIEATQKLHDVEDEKFGDGDESERDGNDSERDFGKFRHHFECIRQLPPHEYPE